MTPRTGALLLLGVAALAVAIVLWSHQRIAARRTLTSDTPVIEDDAAARALNRARMRLAGAELARDEQRRILARERGTSSPAVLTMRPPAEMETFRRALHDPEVNLLQLEAGRAARAVQFGSLIRELGLSADEAAEFDRILAAKEVREMDVYASGRTEGLTEADPALQALNQEIEAEVAKDLRALLGEEGLARYQEHERTAMLRLTVSSMAGAATAAGAPLSPTQAEALVQILAESTPGYAAGKRVKASQANWAAADPRIQHVLTPAQWEAIRWTEPSGPRGVGGRFFPQMTATIRAAREADAQAAASAAVSAPTVR